MPGVPADPDGVRGVGGGKGAVAGARPVSGLSVVQLICWVLRIYLVVLAARAILSWFPVRPGSPLTSIAGLLADLTEPVLRPFRSIIPPVGMFDLSPLVAWLALTLLRSLLLSLVR